MTKRPRRRPVPKPYREITVRVPEKLAEYVAMGVGFHGRDEEEVIVYMLRSYVLENTRLLESMADLRGKL